MIDAKKANEMTRTATDRDIYQRRLKIEEYIRKTADEGKYFVKLFMLVTKDDAGWLRELGYFVRQNGDMAVISWEDAVC